MKLAAMMALAGAAAFVVASCGEGGSAEKQGEKMDNQIEQTFQGHTDPGDGPMEKTGEAIDNMTGTTNNDPVDAVSDATDGDPGTKAPSANSN